MPSQSTFSSFSSLVAVIETAQIIVLVIATVLVVVGLIAVVWKDLSMQQERVGPARRIAEAVIPIIGAAVLLGAVWAWATVSGGG